MKSVRWMFSYILVAVLGLWMAFAVSMKFMTPARAQNAPASGELPAEFMKEVETTQVPSGTNTLPAPGAPPAVVPPPPSGVPEAAAPAVGTENSVGDGATAGVTAPPAPFIQTDGYVYDPAGKRDPFKAFKTIRVAAPDKTKHSELLEPLQRWELDRLLVVGILWDVGKPRAMVRDPDGAVFTVVKNTKIGRNEGFVAAIREGEVVVIETKYEDGNAIKEPRVLELKK